MSKFCQFSQQQFENFLQVSPDGKPLEKGGFHRIPVYHTNELVYAKRIHPELSLRIYSTIEGGFARENGSDAIRICVAWRPPEERQQYWEQMGLARVNPRDPKEPIFPKLVGSDTKVLRVEGWRENLGKRLANYKEILPYECACGCPTVWRTPKAKDKWTAFPGCVWGRACPRQGLLNQGKMVTP